MRFIPALALAAAVLLSGAGSAGAQEKLESLRGATLINQESRTDNMFRPEKDQESIPRNFQKQPPLIPHSIKGYNITQNFQYPTITPISVQTNQKLDKAAMIGM